MIFGFMVLNYSAFRFRPPDPASVVVILKQKMFCFKTLTEDFDHDFVKKKSDPQVLKVLYDERAFLGMEKIYFH